MKRRGLVRCLGGGHPGPRFAWRNARGLRLLVALLILGLHVAGTSDRSALAQSRPRSGQETLSASRAMAQAGDTAGALQAIDAWLSRPTPPAQMAERAVLLLDAARYSVQLSRSAAAQAYARESLKAMDAAKSAFRDPKARILLLQQVSDVQERGGFLSDAADTALKAASNAPDPLSRATLLNQAGRIEITNRRPDAGLRHLAAGLAALGGAPANEGLALRQRIHLNMAGAHLGAGRSAEAQTHLDAAERIDGGPAMAAAVKYTKARILLARDRRAEAYQLLDEVAATGPGDPELRGNVLLLLSGRDSLRGNVADFLARVRSAQDAFAEAPGRDSTNYVNALHAEAFGRMMLPDYRGALQILDRVVAQRRARLGDAAASTLLADLDRGWIGCQTGDFARCARSATDARRISTSIEGSQGLQLAAAAAAQAALAQVKLRQWDLALSSAEDSERLLASAFSDRRMNLSLAAALVLQARPLAALGRWADADRRLTRAIEVLDSNVTPPLFTAEALALRADVRIRRGTIATGMDDSRRSYALLEDTLAIPLAVTMRGQTVSTLLTVRDIAAMHARNLLRHGRRADREEAFEATQIAVRSRSDEATRRAILRATARDPAQAAIIEKLERLKEGYLEDLSGSSAVAQGTSAQALEQIKSLQRELAVLDPRRAAFFGEAQATLADVQSSLRDHQSLVVPVVGDDFVVTWFITRSGADGLATPADGAAIAADVAAIRRSVDFGNVDARGDPPAFASAAAAAIYDVLFRPLEPSLRRNDELLLIPDRVFDNLPPHLLIRKGGEAGGREEWLAERHPVRIIPSLAGFAGDTRKQGSASTPKGFLGVGNPTFREFGRFLAQRGFDTIEPTLRTLSSLSALPETEQELRTLSGLLKESEPVFLLGDEATTPRLMALDLSRFDVISFATHAIMAGEVAGIDEPAIVLTPSPGNPEEGILRASAVARMRMDARQVILSACNTGSGNDAYLTEGFSGLTRAFLFAGAHAVLASHWAIDSLTAVRLTNGMFTGGDGERGTATALQKAMLSIARGPETQLRHPAFWAPFVLVGN